MRINSSVCDKISTLTSPTHINVPPPTNQPSLLPPTHTNPHIPTLTSSTHTYQPSHTNPHIPTLTSSTHTYQPSHANPHFFCPHIPTLTHTCQPSLLLPTHTNPHPHVPTLLCPHIPTLTHTCQHFFAHTYQPSPTCANTSSAHAFPTHPQELSKRDKQQLEQLVSDNRQLEKQRAELMTGFKKQLKLIDILKRQKVT